jgi:hypothetical protein
MSQMFARLYLLRGQLLIRRLCPPGRFPGGLSDVAALLPDHFPDFYIPIRP